MTRLCGLDTTLVCNTSTNKPQMILEMEMSSQET